MAPPAVPDSRAKPQASADGIKVRRAQLLVQLNEGIALFRADRYSEAAERFEAARTAAIEAKIDDLAARAVGDIGSTQFALHQYQPALRSFLEAQRLAVAANDSSAAAAFGVNIASLYAEMGAIESATQWTQGMLEKLSATDRREQLPKLLIQMATLRARQHRMSDALGMFSQGIDAADRAGYVELAAIGWNRVGEELLKQGDLAAAEPALLEAYRIRKLNRLPLDSSYRNLGRLRLEQGDLVSASSLLDRAVELSAGSQGQIPTWDVYHYRGRVRLAQGRLRDALSDLRISVRLARDWRWSVPPDDASRIGAEGWLQKVHSAMVEAGNRLYLQTGEGALIRETFETAEENRASSLRALFSSRDAASGGDLPPQYWAALKRLQRAEVAALRTRDPRAEEALSEIRGEIGRIETASGAITAPLPRHLLSQAQSSMDRDSALFSFHLGDSISWLWALDSEGLALYVLPPRKNVELQVNAAAHAIRDDSAGASQLSAKLYRTLFGALAPRFRNKERWLLALDWGMFDVPVAALTDDSGPKPTYVAERHVVEMIPGVGYWLEARARRDGASRTGPAAPLFVAIGDPVYNLADPRLNRNVNREKWFQRLFGSAPASQLLVLPRLVASGAELDVCARAWNGDRTLLKGRDASRSKLQEQLRRNPVVVHFATHVVESSERPASGLIALSLTDRNEMELLPPVEIAHWRTNAELVVLSGCHSAAGAELPGTGLVGLTRAWLLAGAQSVISSNWNTPDDSGSLFGSLYSNLNAPGTDPARALRDAQREMIRSGGWRSRPRYWGAYSLVGNL